MSFPRTTTALLLLAHLGCGGGSGSSALPDSALPPPDLALPPPDLALPSEPVLPDAAPILADAAIDGGGPLVMSWPAEITVTTVSVKNAFGANLSGLAYEPATATTAAVLWAVQNEPSKIYRLLSNGATYASDTTDGWLTGKVLRYPGNKGSPDSEGLTRTDGTLPELYVAAERDNDDNQKNRQSILRFEAVGTKGLLEATHEWVLTDDLPPANLNCGLEGIAWIPDAHLVARGFIDESTQAPYDPSRYPGHGTGVFLVSVDETGMVYGYVLDHAAGTFTRVATVTTGQTRGVDLTFEHDTGTLWSLCDSGCKGRMTLLDIDTDPASPTAGRIVPRATVSPPKGVSEMNNEGFAIAPLAECVSDRRSFFWSDDQETNGHALRRGVIPCARLY